MVSYDIPEDSPGYAEMTAYLEEEMGAKRVLESQWLVDNEGNSEAILRKLDSRLRKDERLLVQQVVATDVAWRNPILPGDDLEALLFGRGVRPSSSSLVLMAEVSTPPASSSASILGTFQEWFGLPCHCRVKKTNLLAKSTPLACCSLRRAITSESIVKTTSI